ncbi:unnamed protein product, partial [Linum tenue]
MVHEDPSHLFRDRGVSPAGSMPSSVWSGAVHSVGGPRESKGVSPPRWSARYSRLAHEVDGNDRNMGNRQLQDIITPTNVGRMWYHDPYMDRYRQTSVRYLTPKDAANGALADGIEQIKYLTHGKHEMGSEDVSFIRRMTNSLLGCIRAQGRDHRRYPPMPAPVPPPVQVDVPHPPPPYERKKSKKVRER